MNLRIGILFLLLGFGALSQAQVLERKIIIENDHFYYVTVDENSQIGTLYKGSMDQNIGEASAYAIPAGRGISAETNPLAWDIYKGEMYAINFLDHSLNDRNESIKKFPLDQLKKWAVGVEVGDVIMESIDQHTLVLNEPYLFVKDRSKYLNHFYFDAVVVNGSYWMAMANNDELTIWKYANSEWKHSAVKSFEIQGYFNLIFAKGVLNLITNKGVMYTVDLDNMSLVEVDRESVRIQDLIFIEDRDQKKNWSIENGHFNIEKPLRNIIADHATEILK